MQNDLIKEENEELKKLLNDSTDKEYKLTLQLNNLENQIKTLNDKIAMLNDKNTRLV